MPRFGAPCCFWSYDRFIRSAFVSSQLIGRPEWRMLHLCYRSVASSTSLMCFLENPWHRLSIFAKTHNMSSLNYHYYYYYNQFYPNHLWLIGLVEGTAKWNEERKQWGSSWVECTFTMICWRCDFISCRNEFLLKEGASQFRRLFDFSLNPMYLLVLKYMIVDARSDFNSFMVKQHFMLIMIIDQY